jgi:hypothetical protein
MARTDEFATADNSCWRPGLRLLRKGGDQTCVICGSWACHDDLTCSVTCRQALDSGSAGITVNDIQYKWVFYFECQECHRHGWFAGRKRSYCSRECANKNVGARRRDNPRKLAYVCAWCGEWRVSADGLPRPFCSPECKRRFSADLESFPETPRPPAVDILLRRKWKMETDWQRLQSMARDLRVATARAIVEREKLRARRTVNEPQLKMTFEEFKALDQQVQDHEFAKLIGPAAAVRAKLALAEDAPETKTKGKERRKSPQPEAEPQTLPPPEDDGRPF